MLLIKLVKERYNGKLWLHRQRCQGQKMLAGGSEDLVIVQNMICIVFIMGKLWCNTYDQAPKKCACSPDAEEEGEQ